jgi:hypothetical protein
MDSYIAALRSSPSRRRFEAMFGDELGLNPQRAQSSATASAYLDPQTKEDMLSYLARQTGGAISGLGKALDTPGAIFRGVLAGDPTSGFSWDDERRVSGEELLKKYGLLTDKSNPYFSTAAGLAAEIALDPFAIAKLPLSALTTAGKAAKAAGILDNASAAVMARTGFDDAVEAARHTRTGRAAYKWLGDILPAGKKALPHPQGVTPENVAYRPLIGPRVARTKATLEETVKASPEPAKALQQVKDYLTKRGIDYDEVKGQNLGGAFGLGYFNFVDPVVFNPKGAEPFLDALDAAGQAARWSAPARALSRVADKRVDGTYAPADQLFALKRNDAVAKEVAGAEARAGEHLLLAKNTELPPAAKQILGADNLAEDGGRKFIRRFFEGTQTTSDMRLRDLIGRDKVDALVDSWKSIRTDIADDAKALGMRSYKSKDLYGVEWSPRKALEAFFGEYGRGQGRRILNTKTLENEARKRNLLTPGGTIDLEEVSLLPEVQKFIEEGPGGSLTEEQVGAAIKSFLDAKHGPGAADPRAVPFKTFVPLLDSSGNAVMEPVLDKAGNAVLTKAKTAAGKVILDPATGKPQMVPKMRTVKSTTEVVTPAQGKAIARFMMRKSRDVPGNVGMFSENPLKAQARTMVNQAGARGNARHIYASVAEAAVPKSAVAGTRLKRLDLAIEDIAQKTGLQTKQNGMASPAVKRLFQEQIAKANGIADAKTVDLSQYSLPEDVYDRIVRTADFYSSPRAQQDVTTLFDKMTTLFKGFALAWPATKVRDFYSNVFLVWTQAGNGIDVAQGLWSANKVLAGKLDDALEGLREIPRYNVPDAAEMQRRIVEDVSRTGILRSLASNDLLTSNRSALMNQFVPGAAPIRFGDAARELIPDGSRSPLQMLADQFQIRDVQLPFQKNAAFETRNAMLNASQKASDWTDSVARLGGMFALMRQGVAADEAARRITSALVDYGSMTLLERQTARRIFPWWAFQSRIGKFVAEQVATNPGGGYAQTIRAFNVLQQSDEDTYIPEALRQQFAFRVPDALKPYLGIPENANTTTFFKDFDVPGFDVLSLLGPAPTIYGTVRSTASNIAQQAHPLFRTASELSTGIDSFSRRPLEQAVTPIDRLYRAAFGSKTSLNPLVRQAINLVPGPQQRILPVLGGLADDRIPRPQRIAKQAFNALMGVKIQDVDPAWQLQDARRLLSDQLGGFMQDYTESYVPEEVLPQLPPELMPSYMLFKTLGRDLRESRK